MNALVSWSSLIEIHCFSKWFFFEHVQHMLDFVGMVINNKKHPLFIDLRTSFIHG